MSLDMFPDPASEYLIKEYDKMPTLTCTRGLPGSGKSTWARQQDAVRANRDDLRMSMFGRYFGLTFEQENMITEVQQAIAAAALKAGKNVVVDDMHLRPKYLKVWDDFAQKHGAHFRTKEFLTPVEECQRRDRMRDRTVGSSVISDLARKYLPKGQFLPYTRAQAPEVAPPVEKATFDPLLDHTIIVDIDGTMTLGPHDRDPYDFTKVSQDLPRRAVVNLVNRLLRDGYLVTFMSGREDICQFETAEWLEKVIDNKHHGQCRLFMRKAGDSRPDAIVKRELFDAHVRGQYNVKFVLDDRDSVVKMWRDLGLACFQVDYGNF